MRLLTAPFHLLARYFEAKRRRDDTSDVWPWPGADTHYRENYDRMREAYRRSQRG